MAEEYLTKDKKYFLISKSKGNKYITEKLKKISERMKRSKSHQQTDGLVQDN